MDSDELTSAAKLQIAKYMISWLAAISSILIVVFGGAGALLFKSIHGTAENSAKEEVNVQVERLDEKINELEMATENASEKFQENVEKLSIIREEGIRTLSQSITELKLTEQKVEIYLEELQEGDQLLKNAKAISKDISNLSKSIADNPQIIENIANTLDSVPPDSIIAFSSGCPTSGGWDKYIPAQGRFILGSGDGAGLTPRVIDETGGVESYALTIADLPEHHHKYNDWHYDDRPHNKNKNFGTPKGDESGDRVGIDRDTAAVGAGKKHTNMPPFLVLEFCIKR